MTITTVGYNPKHNGENKSCKNDALYDDIQVKADKGLLIKTDKRLLTSVGKMGCKQAAHFGAKVLQM